MIPSTRLELISICEHLRYGISSTRNYYENYLQQINNNDSPILRNIVNNLEYVVMVLTKVNSLLCNTSPNMFSAFNELDKLYTRIISEQYVPGAIRAIVYEVWHEVRKLLYEEKY